MKEEIEYQWTREADDEGLLVANHSGVDGTVGLFGSHVPWCIDFHINDLPALRKLVETLERVKEDME